MGEILQLHIGQCGCRIGGKFWEQSINETISDINYLENRNILYNEWENTNKLSPRCIFIDLEPYIVENECYNSLKDYHNDTIYFNKSSFISGTEDATDNYAYGYYRREHQNIGKTEIRKQTERCDQMSSFIITHSLIGGTGSGLGSFLIEKIHQKCPKTPIISFQVVPTYITSGSIIAPYNYLTANAVIHENSDMNILLDNESLYRYMGEMGHTGTSLSHINQIISTIINTMISPMKYIYQSHSTVFTIGDLLTNLIITPKLKYIIPSYNGINDIESNVGRVNNKYNNISTGFRAEICYNPNNYLLNTVSDRGKILSSHLQFQGKMSLSETYETIHHIKHLLNLSFSPFSQIGASIRITQKAQIFPENWGWESQRHLLLLLLNCTGISNYFGRIMSWFDALYNKHTFTHHMVGEGMEEGELSDARMYLEELIEYYKEFN